MNQEQSVTHAPRKAARTPKSKFVAELSPRILAALQNDRTAGSPDQAAPFLTLAQIVELCPGATAVQVAAALRKSPCREGVITAIPGDPDSPLLLAAEAEKLVRDGALLLRLVRRPVRGCSAESPVQPLSVLWRGLHPSLRKSAADYWPRHLHLLPTGLAEVSIRSRPRAVPGIHDLRYPRPEVLLAERLVRVLESQRDLGDRSYPATLLRLVELTSPGAAAKFVAEAVAQEAMASRVMMAFPGVVDSPLVLKEDTAGLASSVQLLNYVVSRAVTVDNQALSVEKLVSLKGLHPDVQPLFATSVRKLIADQRLPAGLAAIRLTRKWYVFRMLDVVTGSVVDAPASEGSQVGFSEALEAAFDRLSVQSRLPGCVSLADLRPAMAGYSREEIDAELIRLRRSGRYSLSAVEGRYPLTEAEQQACLVVDGKSHLLVRRSS